MTKQQRITMMCDWWPNACRAQGWDKDDRDKRMRVLSMAVSFAPGHFRTIADFLLVLNSGEPVARELRSANDLDSREDIDRVKAVLLFLADKLVGAREMDHPEDGTARRVRHTIIDQRLRCLALYPLSRPMGRDGAEAYVAEIVNDMFNRGSRRSELSIHDLTDTPQFYRRKGSSDLHEGPSQVRRLVMRLDQLLHQNKKPNGPRGFRVVAGHSLHDMKIVAKLQCDCAACCKARLRAIIPSIPPVPVLESNPF